MTVLATDSPRGPVFWDRSTGRPLPVGPKRFDDLDDAKDWLNWLESCAVDPRHLNADGLEEWEVRWNHGGRQEWGDRNA